MKRPLLAVLAALLLLGVVAWLLTLPGGPSLSGLDGPEPYSREAFDEWLRADPERQFEFEGLVHFLASHDVGNVVPVWQLTRTDSNRAKKCDRPQFLIPPSEDWPQIVPVLALVRDEIVPAVGAVEAVSSYRTIDFNACIGGASQSRHLDFAAIDLVAVDGPDNEEMFRRLCSAHKRLGPASKFGLGAYFDPEKPGNVRGRFHVDVSGFRSWGASKRADSSGCLGFE